jgi:hypothetical protein
MIIGRAANLTAAIPGRTGLPVPQPLLGGLPVWRVFQHAIIYFAGSFGNGQFNREAAIDCYKNIIR